MFESWTENALRFARERYRPRVFAPVAATLTVAAFASARPEGVIELGLSLIVCASLLFQFRLWDDLGDRGYDRVHHPDRVLPRIDPIYPFQALLFLCAVANLILLSLLGRSYSTFLGLNAAAFAWYGAIPGAWRRNLAGRHLALVKYPAFVWLIAPVKSQGSDVFLSMAIVYLCCSVYELVHDREIRSQVQGGSL